jgi:hypothetical protein
MMRARVLRVGVAAMIAAATGCSNNSPTTPTEPPPQTFTEVFSGSIGPNGAASHSFIAQASGTVSLTLLTLQPDATAPIGIALGTWTGVACQVIIAADRALPGTILNGSVGSSGSLCARASDAAGNIAQGTQVTYEFQVVHP